MACTVLLALALKNLSFVTKLQIFRSQLIPAYGSRRYSAQHCFQKWDVKKYTDDNNIRTILALKKKRDDSALSGYASSILSIKSAGTSLSYSSLYSPAEQLSAVEELVMLLAGDPVLCSLYKDALKDRAIGADRFIRNL